MRTDGRQYGAAEERKKTASILSDVPRYSIISSAIRSRTTRGMLPPPPPPRCIIHRACHTAAAGEGSTGLMRTTLSSLRTARHRTKPLQSRSQQYRRASINMAHTAWTTQDDVACPSRPPLVRLAAQTDLPDELQHCRVGGATERDFHVQYSLTHSSC